MKKKEIDFIIPSYHSKVLTKCCVESFERNKGEFNFRYIIVENAADDSYKDDISEISSKLLWINNKCKYTHPHASWANAEAIEIGLQHATSEYVFICHNDVAAVHPKWMNLLYNKTQEDYEMIGTRFDNTRIGALHQSGILINRTLALKVPSVYPRIENGKVALDVGDSLTEYFRENDLRYFCFRNTHNKNVNVELQDPYENVTYDRVVNDNNEVIYMHLGRGSLKEGAAQYQRRGAINDWVNFVEANI